MPYPEEMVTPMRRELTNIGFAELKTAQDVDAFLADKDGDAVIVVNSVCGCAAGKCRPGVALSLTGESHPTRLATVFAGNDVESTARLREVFADVPPSSPSIFILKNGELFDFIPRHQIENQEATAIGQRLMTTYENIKSG